MPDEPTYLDYLMRSAAYHEAGHAVVAHLFDYKFDHVEITPPPLLLSAIQGYALWGSVHNIDRNRNLEGKMKTSEAIKEVSAVILMDMIHTYAGPIAEVYLDFDINSKSVNEFKIALISNMEEGKGIENSDYEYIRALYSCLENLKQGYIKPDRHSDMDALFQRDKVIEKSIGMLIPRWEEVTLLAEALIKRGRVSYDEACEIIGSKS